VLNDIGPVIEADGLARITDYVGQGRSYLTWMHAARGLRETMGEIYPDFAIEDWLRLAKRLMALGTGGRIAFDYDMKIAVPIEAAEDARDAAEAKARDEGSAAAAAADLWPLFAALEPVPLVVVHGATSDILSAQTAQAMASAIPIARWSPCRAWAMPPRWTSPRRARRSTACWRGWTDGPDSTR
jgi:hypothetical protein